VVTDAMLQMLKVRPADPVHALSEYLIRKDRQDALEAGLAIFFFLQNDHRAPRHSHGEQH